MICKKCGSPSLKDTDKFCSECGTRFEQIGVESNNQPEIADLIANNEERNDLIISNKDQENVIQEKQRENKVEGRVAKKEKNKEKKKKNKIAIVLIIMFIIFSGLYVYSNIQKETEMEQERITLQYVTDLSVYQASMETMYYSSALYSDGLVEAWEKGLSGDINVAIKNYQKKENIKAIESIITEELEYVKKVYYEYIQPISIQGGSFDGIPSLLEEVDRTSRAFIEFTINPTGSYSSYTNDRTRLHNEFKSAKERLKDRVEVLKGQYDITNDMIIERGTELRGEGEQQ